MVFSPCSLNEKNLEEGINYFAQVFCLIWQTLWCCEKAVGSALGHGDSMAFSSGESGWKSSPTRYWSEATQQIPPPPPRGLAISQL